MSRLRRTKAMRRREQRSFRPRLEMLEDRRVPVNGLFIENFSSDFDLAAPGFDSFDTDPLTIPGGDTDNDPLTTLGPDEFMVPHEVSAAARLSSGLRDNDTNFLLVPGNPGQFYTVDFLGNRNQPGELAPDEQVDAVGLRFLGLGTIEFTGQHGAKTVRVNSFLAWDSVTATSHDLLDNGRELGAIDKVTFTPIEFLGVDDVAVLVLGNAPPPVQDDYVLAASSEATLIGPTDNDRDTDGDGQPDTPPVEIVSFTQPAHGTVESFDGNPLYLVYHSQDYAGDDSFTYSIAEAGRPFWSTATVHVRVNHRPEGNPDRYVFGHGTAGAISRDVVQGLLANDHDVDGEPLSVALRETAKFGNVTLNADGSFSYAPTTPDGRRFNDSFTYTVTDGNFVSDPILVTLRVDRNQAPVAADGLINAPHGAPAPLHGTVGTMTDADGDALTAVIEINGEHGSVTRLEVANGQLDFDYWQGLTKIIGPDQFSFRLFDGYDSSAAKTVEIRVPNHDPIAIPDFIRLVPQYDERTVEQWLNAANEPPPEGDVGLTESWGVAESPDFELYPFLSYPLTPGQAISGIDDFDLDHDTLAYRIVSDPEAGRILDSDERTGRFVYEVPHLFPQRDAATGEILPSEPWTELGFDRFTYEITDGYATSRSEVLISRPLSYAHRNFVLSTHDGVPVETRSLLASGSVVVDGPAAGSLELSPDGDVSYVPRPGFVGADYVRLLANFTVPPWFEPEDLTIVVLASAPRLQDDRYQAERDSFLIVTRENGVLANDYHPDGRTLRLDFFTEPAHGRLISQSPDGSFTYRPDPGFFGTDAFTYQVSDGQGNVSQATATIDVSANRRPHLANTLDLHVTNVATPFMNGPAIGDLAWLDDDGDSVTPFVVPDARPSHGRVALRTNGNRVHVEYYPEKGQFPPYDEFRIAISDGQAQSDSALVRVFRDSNTPPIAVDDRFVIQNVPIGATGTEPVSIAFPGVTWNDPDRDDDFLSVSLVSNTTHGFLILHDDGGFVYQPDRDFVGDDRFVYQVDDGSGITSTATVILRVSDEPIPTVFDDAISENWPGEYEDPATLPPPNGNPAPVAAVGALGNDRLTGWWDGPFGGPNAADWEPVLIAHPRQVRTVFGDLLLPEGQITLNSGGLVRFYNSVTDASGTHYVFTTGVVDATYAIKNVRTGFLSNFAAIRFVVGGPPGGTHATIQLSPQVPHFPFGTVDVQASPGALLTRIAALDPPAPPPAGFEMPYDKMIYLAILPPGPGDAATVTLTYAQPLPAGLTYLKYGSRDDNPLTPDDESQPQWYEFAYDPATATGAEIVGNQIILHFADGSRGDDDRLANGTILDPGLPVLRNPPPRIANVVINHGQRNPKDLRFITITFNEVVLIQNGAFIVEAANGRRARFDIRTRVEHGRTIVELKLRASVWLRQQEVRFTIVASRVHDLTGLALDGNGDVAPGDDFALLIDLRQTPDHRRCRAGRW